MAQRTTLKPGWNMFSPQQDVELGKRAALDAEKHLPLCNDPKVDAYLTQLGLKLVAKLPTGGVQYPFEFHCVNDKAINAFALPGGYVFINRGVIESADNEAQLAAVIAHELSHVALRHGAVFRKARSVDKREEPSRVFVRPPESGAPRRACG